MSWLCKIIGHRWHWKSSQDYIKHGEEWRRSYRVTEPYCMRCGAPNPKLVKAGGGRM